MAGIGIILLLLYWAIYAICAFADAVKTNQINTEVREHSQHNRYIRPNGTIDSQKIEADYKAAEQRMVAEFKARRKS